MTKQWYKLEVEEAEQEDAAWPQEGRRSFWTFRDLTGGGGGSGGQHPLSRPCLSRDPGTCPGQFSFGDWKYHSSP